MKAISKFKGLLTPKPTASETPSSPPPLETPSTTAEFAARVLRERQEFLNATRGGGKASLAQFLNPQSPITETAGQQPSSLPNSDQLPQTQQQHLPPVLGIGTGGIDDFPATIATAAGAAAELPCAAGDVVSDSPTAVDFSVYDRAFEEEVARIRRSTSRRGPGGGRGGRGHHGGGVAEVGGGPAAEIYQTRFSERGGGGGGGGNGSRWSFAAGVVASQERGQQQDSAAGSRFAELVAKAMEGAGRAGEGGGEGDGESAGAGAAGESSQI
jgi:[calcium/calmodulin-dependent protein kinase] kinase